MPTESVGRVAFVVLCGCASLAAGGGFATRTPFASLRFGGFGGGALLGSRAVAGGSPRAPRFALAAWAGRRLLVGVLTANAPARAFYESLGAVLIGSRSHLDEGQTFPESVYAWPDLPALGL